MDNPSGFTRREVLAAIPSSAAAMAFFDLATALPARAGEAGGGAAPSLARPQDEPIYNSAVGSLYGPVQRIRDGYGWASESFTSDKYKAADYPAWRQRMRQRVFAAMQYAPGRCDFAAETVEKVDCGKFVREKVYFNTTPELRVPAYVLVPKGLKGRGPAVVALHDHGAFYRWGKEKLVKLPDEHPSLTAFKAGGYDGRSIADDLAERGYVVIVIDMFYWGERRMRLADDPAIGTETETQVRAFNTARRMREEVVARMIYTSGFTWAGLMFWDDIRTVDYLASRPEVDPQRIGCVGLSVGAWRANHLAAFDERIKAAVAVCWLTSFKDIQARHTEHTVGFTKVLPGLYRQLDMPDVISLAAPRRLLNINGLKDTLFPVETGVKSAYHTLETVYAKLGVPGNFKGHLYDSPHQFNREMQAEAWEWLAAL